MTFKFVGLLALNMVFLVCTFAYLYAKGWLNEENLPDPKAADKSDTANHQSEESAHS